MNSVGRSPSRFRAEQDQPGKRTNSRRSSEDLCFLFRFGESRPTAHRRILGLDQPDQSERLRILQSGREEDRRLAFPAMHPLSVKRFITGIDLVAIGTLELDRLHRDR